MCLVLPLGLTNCAEPTLEERAAELINSAAYESVADFESFEIVRLSPLDSTFTKFENSPEVIRIQQACINEEQEAVRVIGELNRVDKYLSETEPLLKQAKRRESYALINLNQVLGYNSYGGKIVGPTMNSSLNYSNACKDVKTLKGYVAEAKTYKKKLLQQLEDTKEKRRAMYGQIKEMHKTFQREYIGQYAELNCRFKNMEKNFEIHSYDIIFNDSITGIISKTDTVSRAEGRERQQFVKACLAFQPKLKK